MADPTKFTPGFDYSAYESSNPAATKPGAQLDNDFANIETSIDEAVDAITDVRRSDGALKNGVVTSDSLSTAVKTALGIEISPTWSAFASLTPAADKVPYFTGSTTAALADLNAFGRSLIGATNIVTLQQYGGIPDAGGTDNSTALTNADAAGADAILLIGGRFDILSDIRPSTPLIGLGGWITRNDNADTYYPKKLVDLAGGNDDRSSAAIIRRTPAAGDWTNPADGAYHIVRNLQSLRHEMVNLAGVRDKVTGTTSQVVQQFHNISHLGGGDCYGVFYSNSATETGDTSNFLDWGYQKSVGMANGQANAASTKVNLYGFGDVAINDGGYNDVSMFGHVCFLTHDGGDSGDYEIPRLGAYFKSTGTSDIDAIMSFSGRATVGLDLSNGTWAANNAFSLATGMRIAWDADGTPPSGKFSAQSFGSTFTYHTSSQLIDQVEGTTVFRRAATFVQVQPGADGFSNFRVSGASATAGLHLGQSTTASVISANSTGSDSTSLQFRTASSGTEAVRFLIDAAGAFRPPTDNTGTIGTASFKIDEYFGNNTAINASDENQKQDIKLIPDEWLDAWAEFRWVCYRWKSAVSAKGDFARWHFGAIAQQFESIFEKRGLDPYAMGPLCRDKEVEQKTITRKEKRFVTRVKTVDKQVTKVVETFDGTAYVQREEKITVKEPVTQAYPVVDGDGRPVVDTVKETYDTGEIDADGQPLFATRNKLVPRTKVVEVTEDVEEEVELSEVVDVETGRWIYGLRYGECQAFEAAYQRREMAKLTREVERLSAAIKALSA